MQVSGKRIQWPRRVFYSMEKKMCICVYVSGRQYFEYVPFFIYFCKKAYPDYYIYIASGSQKFPRRMFYVIDKLFPNDGTILCEQIMRISNAHDPDTVKTRRWVMWPDRFNEFENIYIGDVDLFLVNETPSLLDRHLAVCEKYNSLYSNTCGIDDPKSRGNRMTGIHFFKTNEYRFRMELVLKKYRKLIAEKGYVAKNFYNDKLQKPDNQYALYCLLKEAGLKILNHNWFEYNGIHLGHSRVPGRWDRLFREDSLHREYYKKFHQLIETEEFKKMYYYTNDIVKNEFDVLIEAGERLCQT